MQLPKWNHREQPFCPSFPMCLEPDARCKSFSPLALPLRITYCFFLPLGHGGRHSCLNRSYKQMQQETQEYFMKCPPPAIRIASALITNRYVSELNDAARRREVKHKDRLQQVQLSISE